MKGHDRDSVDESLQSSLRQFKAGIFQVLAHPTRIHIIECLRDGEVSVADLLAAIPVEPSNLSQHLAALRSKGLTVQRREGTSVFYSLRDPLLIEVLDTMRRYFKSHLEEALEMLKRLED